VFLPQWKVNFPYADYSTLDLNVKLTFRGAKKKDALSLPRPEDFLEPYVRASLASHKEKCTKRVFPHIQKNGRQRIIAVCRFVPSKFQRFRGCPAEM